MCGRSSPPPPIHAEVAMPDADSLYRATADTALAFPALDGAVRADVAIVGGGYTGLSAALHLAEAGIDAIVVEAERVGWGASGRNGGQLHSGQRRDVDWLEARLGRDDAHRLWQLGEDAKTLAKDLIRRHAIDCSWRDGLIEATHKRRMVDDDIAYVEKLKRDYGYAPVEWLDRDALAAAISTGVYLGGIRDMGAGHLDPLKFAQGLARAAAGAGARIFEGTRAARLVRTEGGGIEIACQRPAWEVAAGGDKDRSGPRVAADIVILAGNGYLAGVDTETEARVMPIDNYIVATAPIGAGKPGGIIAGGEAVSDSRFVVYYFRPSPDGRLIFGGGETYARRAEADIAGLVRPHLARIYPQLADTPIEYAWGGRLAITLTRLPFIRRLRPGVYAAAGYSGQGVAIAPFAGKVLADAIRGNPAVLDRFAALPVPRFPGGRLLRTPALIAGMTWYALRDRI
jgi:gamma-glutamylputrescine oxidase